jgi:tetratricopeptide (TPR) repeat protein
MRSSRSDARAVRLTAAAALAALAAGVAAPSAAAAFAPSGPDEVLLEVAPRAALADLRAAEREYQAAPQDPRAAVRLVDTLLATGRREADARYFGRAEAVLRDWRSRPAHPLALDVEWADALQHRHDYDAARAVLDTVLARDPDEPRARLIRAQLNLSQGRLGEARRDCAALAAAGPTGIACLAQVLSVGGRLEAADRLLRGLADRELAPASLASWIYSAVGDVAERAGRPDALAWLERATVADPTDHYAQLALVDALLARGDLDRAEARLRTLPRSDGALLRLAICARRRGVADGAAEELEARFEELERRGEPVHLRDRARLRLDVRADVAGALADATNNFSSQREPADVRLLLRAAQAAGSRAAAAPALRWRESTGYQDAVAAPAFAWAAGR